MKPQEAPRGWKCGHAAPSEHRGPGCRGPPTLPGTPDGCVSPLFSPDFWVLCGVREAQLRDGHRKALVKSNGLLKPEL